MPILPATDHNDSHEPSRRQILYVADRSGQRTMTGRIETEFGVRTRIGYRHTPESEADNPARCFFRKGPVVTGSG
jgi:hypothetical protein